MVIRKLYIPEFLSGGLFLSYKCTSRCKHCMYACSPEWKADWIPESDADMILTDLAKTIQPSPHGPGGIGVNHGLHFTGGEPFLNFDLLLRLVHIAQELHIPSTFVETNCFWCIDDEATRNKLTQLRDNGLKGILISVNPFIREEVPFERTERAVRIGREVFGRNAIIYQEVFYELFKRLESPGTMSFQEYLKKAREVLRFIELLPMGRAVYHLGYLFRKHPAKRFFGESCREELTRPWHVHVDNYGNYMTGYCGGISLGDARNLDVIYRGIDLHEYPILEILVKDIKRLYEFGKKEFGYTERADGYISKCHLCVDIRMHIAQKTDAFKELRPREFYSRLDEQN